MASTPCLTFAVTAILMAKAIQHNTAVTFDMIIAICDFSTHSTINERLTSSIALLPRDAQAAMAKMVVRPDTPAAMGLNTIARVKSSLATTRAPRAPPIAPLVSEPLESPRPEGLPMTIWKPKDLGKHPEARGLLSRSALDVHIH